MIWTIIKIVLITILFFYIIGKNLLNKWYLSRELEKTFLKKKIEYSMLKN